MKKLGLALGGGGCRGIAHIGFLQALEEENIKPDYIVGSSIGSVVGCFYALGMSPSEMMVEIKKLKKKHVVDFSLNPIFSGALMKSKKIKRKIKQYLGDKTFNDLKMPFYAATVDLKSGNRYLAKGDDDLTTCIVASCSIPGIFKPVPYKDMLLCDGAVLNRVPCYPLKSLGAEVVIGIDVLGEIKVPEKERMNTIERVFRMFEVVDNELTNRCKSEEKPDFFILPNMEGISQFDFKKMEMAYESGYKIGKEKIAQIKRALND